MTIGDITGMWMNRTCKAAVAALMLAVGLAGSVAAGPYEDGVAAYKKGDYATAVRLILVSWFRKPAERGGARPPFVMPKTDEEALAYFEREAEQGDPLSQYLLGFWYLKGDGVPQNYGEAMRWFRKAANADRSDYQSQFNIGELYLKGNGVPQDYVQAHMWFNLAAASSSLKPQWPSSHEVHDDAVHERDLVASKMTPAQIGEAQKLAREWKPK
jgi:TPR repeat protein